VAETEIEFGNLHLRERMVERAGILFQPLAMAGLRNDDDIVMGKQPGERDLRWCHIVASRERGELRVLEQSGPLDR
jgi:hypothetical protein